MARCKKKTTFIVFSLVLVMVLAGFAACSEKRSLPKDISGELTIVMWSGDNQYYPDIGNMKFSPNDLLAQNVAAAYATAKEFNKIYPNIQINFFAKSGGNSDDGPWEQHRENFRMQYGVHPDIYASDDLVGDIQRGLIADLSIFKDDPVYKSFNPQIMAMMNFEGRQFGIPQYLIPWGVFINKSLAKANNIDVPGPDWNFAEYTSFISHHSPNEYYGSMGDYDNDVKLIDTGTRDFRYMLLNRQPGDQFVNINSDATRDLLRSLAQWRLHSVNANNDLGLVSTEFMEANWRWSYKFFLEGRLLTLTGDPWVMGDAAHPSPYHWGSVKAADWDIYPRPSTDYMESTVGILLDPFVIRNYAMDDGDPELSAEEEAKLRIAWELAKFWCGSTRAMEARARQMFRDGETLKSCLSDSFPLVTGPEFIRQMDIWYTPEIHQRYKDENKMPGFHYVLELWEKGQFWDISEKCYPWYYDFEGSRRIITYEWENAWNPAIAGTASTNPNWLDRVYARLGQWNTALNQRWEAEVQKLNDSLNRYYPKR